MLAPQDLGTCPGPWIQWSWRASAAPSAVALDWSGVRAPALLALCDFDYLRGFHAAFYAILASAHLYFSNFSRCTPVFFAILVPAHLYFSRCAMRERARAKNRDFRDYFAIFAFFVFFFRDFFAIFRSRFARAR